MEIASVVIRSMKNIGIDIENEITKDIDLRNYISDSFVFISFVVEIERSLGVELPYEMLLYDKLASYNGFCSMIDNFISGQKET